MTANEDSTAPEPTSDWRLDPEESWPGPDEPQKLAVLALPSASTTLSEFSELIQKANDRLEQMIVHAGNAGMSNHEIAVAAQISLNRVQAILKN